jgi:beta-N-acetylhexosaminidase
MPMPTLPAGRRALVLRVALPSAVALVLFVAPGSSAERGAQPTLAQLVGQHLLVRMEGTTPSGSLLGRIRRGEVAGVVLFGDNIRPGGVPSLVAKLQNAARAGGQLPLLIAVDQEGGTVKRLPGPPTVAPSAMTSDAAARAQGRATGRELRALGIGVDLAPVLDVPISAKAFIASRAFSRSAAIVGARGRAFAAGLASARVAATVKHFPGLGRLAVSTDVRAGRVAASRAALARDLKPFADAIHAGVPAVMVSTASYPAYGSTLPAACARKLVHVLLRGTLGFEGVVMTDDLATAGVRATFPPEEASIRAVLAGADLLIVAGAPGSAGERHGAEAYAALLAAARAGRLPLADLRSSYERVAAFKRRFA